MRETRTICDGAVVGTATISLTPRLRGIRTRRGSTPSINSADMTCKESKALSAIVCRIPLFTIVIAMMTLSACSRGGPGSDIASSAFDSAPADIKQSWNDSMAAWKSRHYAQAATNFAALQSKTSSLSPQQSEALTKAVEEFGQEAFEVANKGDAGATEAVKALRGTGRRSPTGN